MDSVLQILIGIHSNRLLLICIHLIDFLCKKLYFMISKAAESGYFDQIYSFCQSNWASIIIFQTQKFFFHLVTYFCHNRKMKYSGSPLEMGLISIFFV